MTRRPRIPGTRGTAGMKRLKPGMVALIVAVDWRDPMLTPEEQRRCKARADCDRLFRCPECGSGDGLSETIDPGKLRVNAIEHADGCCVEEEAFARDVVAPFWRRVGRPPRFAALACVVSATFELEETGDSRLFDPRAVGLCLSTLEAFEQHWGLAA